MIYREIEGFEGLYNISEYGDILRLRKVVPSARSKSGTRVLPEIIIKQQLNKGGYNFVNLTDEYGYRKPYTIHRLVAKAFIPNPNNYPSINHKDEIKTNNHYSNLEWCTHQYNNLYNGRQLRANETLRNTVSSRKAVIKLDLEYNFIEEFQSINEACRKCKVFKQNLSSHLNNKTKKVSYKGYIWKFKK